MRKQVKVEGLNWFTKYAVMRIFGISKANQAILPGMENGNSVEKCLP